MTVEQLIELARALPAEDRKRLAKELLLTPEADQQPQGIAALLVIAGTAHSNHRDVSSNKADHLAEAYSDQ